jgi:hypothetical protein
MGGACTMFEINEKFVQSYLKVRDHCGDLGIDREIILQFILEK